MATARYVIPNGKSGWDVVEEGHLRGTARAKTKAQAVARARDVVRREGGGEVLVMNRAGKITDAKSVAAPKRKAARA
jgi:Uncharacterized protein conserved in bacteria (DUF2188)